MDKNYQDSKNRLIFLIALIIFFANQLPFLTDMRPVMYDEAWYGNTAFNFANGNGFRNTVVGSGGNANFLLPLLTGSMFHIFGFSLFTIRMTAVLCGAATLFIIHRFLKRLNPSTLAAISTYALFLSLGIFNTIFRFGRPECIALTCMAGGILFMLRYMEKSTMKEIVGVSIFAMLSALAHPHALLLFFLWGVWLVITTFKKKNKKKIPHLLTLLLFSIIGFGAVIWVGFQYNGGDIGGRFSVSNIKQAIPVYLTVFFASKHTIYLPLLLLLVISLIPKQVNSISVIALTTLCFFILFPILFSSDLEMVETGASYVALCGTMFAAPALDLIKTRINGKRIWILAMLFTIYCIFNLGLIVYYNYAVKYEKCNTVLQKDFSKLIPSNATVYVPMRQWPMTMNCNYYSDHYRHPLPEKFDYIILNTQDIDIYNNNQIVLQNIQDYKLIYQKSTKQYGTVRVFAKK